MKDRIPKGTGTDKIMKGDGTITTPDAFISAFNNGGVKYDSTYNNDPNNGGADVIGSPYSKQFCLPDGVVANLGLTQDDPSIADAFDALVDRFAEENKFRYLGNFWGDNTAGQLSGTIYRTKNQILVNLEAASTLGTFSDVITANIVFDPDPSCPIKNLSDLTFDINGGAAYLEGVNMTNGSSTRIAQFWMDRTTVRIGAGSTSIPAGYALSGVAVRILIPNRYKQYPYE